MFANPLSATKPSTMKKIFHSNEHFDWPNVCNELCVLHLATPYKKKYWVLTETNPDIEKMKRDMDGIPHELDKNKILCWSRRHSELCIV